MKILTILFFLFLTACGRESSPDGRSQIRDENLQKEIELLKNQNIAILDSITVINQELKKIKDQ